MGGWRVLGQASGGWRRGLGIRATSTAAGFGTKARHQLQRRGASKPSDPPGDQPFPGLLRPGTFSREELVDVLRAAVVDRKGPLVTLNKPQGLPVTGKPGELTLLSVLPELSRSLGLGEQEVQVVRASGKEASGLVLLSSCPQTASRLQKFFTHSRRARKPTATYCAVTDGIPVTSEGKIQAALKLEHIDGVNLVVPVQSPSRKDIMEGVKRTLSHFRVVATGSGCALVQLQPLTAVSVPIQQSSSQGCPCASSSVTEQPIFSLLRCGPWQDCTQQGSSAFLQSTRRPSQPENRDSVLPTAR
ncbi:PREDICTED: RNA pseudouridylate synthase domain-containing protein 3 isoform X2 [Bison bison bison]|uniref:RNA pseudouridylate synthase domain-containing protein 3 isoform X2 n=1 Tax=Bison bison bison TaxID=43346 RepID=A0A6P3HBC8_BISBB|nr:PREDICTED: RNA pseudouridylate synthase domain-containing protein 3 isoform X2 [Bison bison bison]